ncbi:defensin, partial [Genlisea aurea]
LPSIAGILFFFFAAKPSPVEEEKKACKYRSEKSWGVCFSDLRCSETCKKEGFENGDCKGLRRRCFCFNRC